jgi:hypothetical protein
MRLPANPPRWLPFSFGSVADLATALPGQLLRVQLIVGSFVAGSVAWFVATGWFPVVDVAVAQLPEQSAIRARELEWLGPAPARLAENAFLSLVVDPQGAAALVTTADLRVELGRNELRLRSLFGYLAVDYPAGYRIALGRTEGEAWWGAWRTPLVALVGLGTLVGLCLLWGAVGAVYSVPVRLLAFYANRMSGGLVCWRLGIASLLPGAVLFGAAVLLYGLERLHLVGLLFAWLLHLVVGWLYVGLAPFWLPRSPAHPVLPGNPFQAS